MIAATSKLALGTVQFGLDYGISNHQGQTKQDEVDAILTLASKHGVSLLDTSCGYGNAEKAIGHFKQSSFEIVTKTPAFETPIGKQDCQHLLETFEQSRQYLSPHRINAVLFHHGKNLLQPNGELLYRALAKLKAQGLIAKIGVSVYSKQEIEQICQHYDIDIIQLPFNMLDQQLYLDGTLEQLNNKNISIHVRSIFLQGLLLMKPSELPDYFKPIKNQLIKLHQFVQDQNMTMLEAAYHFVAKIPSVEHIICGVNNTHQLQQIIDMSKQKPTISLPDFAQFSIDDQRFTCPVNWPRK